MAQAIEGGSAETKNVQPQSGGVFNQLVGTALGLILQGGNDRRQVRMNDKLMRQQVTHSKELARWEQAMGLQLWDKTGYAAQRRQMEAAGINPGLMYGSAGNPGTTHAGNAPLPTSGAAPVGGGEIGMGIQLGLQNAMLKANIENVQADTKLKTAEATKKEGVDTANIAAETGLTIQKTENEKVNNTILKYQEAITQIEQRVKEGTEQDAIKAIRNAAESTTQELRSDTVKANIDERTQGQLIKQINRVSEEQSIRIQAAKLGLIKANADIDAVNKTIHKMNTEINNMIQSNIRDWDKMSQNDRELAIKQIVAEAAKQNSDFNTSTAAYTQQWADLLLSIITLSKSGGSKAPIGFK